MTARQDELRAAPKPGIALRCARPAEAPQLTALALRSKAHWGYNAAFLEACVGPLTVTPARIRTSPVFVAQADQQVVGFYGLAPLGDDADLAYLFVEPAMIGRGLGGRLWRHAIETARSLGFRRLRIESDPYAEAFYRAMGAVRVGEVPSEAVQGRMLPLLVYPL